MQPRFRAGFAVSGSLLLQMVDDKALARIASTSSKLPPRGSRVEHIVQNQGERRCLSRSPGYLNKEIYADSAAMLPSIYGTGGDADDRQGNGACLDERRAFFVLEPLSQGLLQSLLHPCSFLQHDLQQAVRHRSHGGQEYADRAWQMRPRCVGQRRSH